jgi:hypothetical protein
MNRVVIPNASENVAQLEPIYIAGGLENSLVGLILLCSGEIPILQAIWSWLESSAVMLKETIHKTYPRKSSVHSHHEVSILEGELPLFTFWPGIRDLACEASLQSCDPMGRA